MKTTKSKIRCGGMLAILVLALGLTAEVANADFTFGTPTNLGPTVNSSADDLHPTVSADGLSLLFHSFRSGGSGGADLWVTRRPTVSDPWEIQVNLGELVNSSVEERAPSVSSDGLELYFHSNRPGGQGGTDLWVTTRATVSDPWGEPVNLGPTVNTADDRNPDISADGLSLYFASNRPGGYGDTDFWVTTRITKNAEWGTPVHLGSTVNSSYAERQPTISADGLWLFFNDYSNPRPGGYGGEDIWMTTRPTPEGDWGPPVNLGPTVNTPYSDIGPDISYDGRTLFFSSNRLGGSGAWDLWQVSIEPVVDFNGDGIVEIGDLLFLIESWGQDDPTTDIGPAPWGDGIVDVADLEVLMSYWGQEAFDPALVAHWKLDETQGSIAYDSAGEYDATLHGDPTW